LLENAARISSFDSISAAGEIVGDKLRPRQHQGQIFYRLLKNPSESFDELRTNGGASISLTISVHAEALEAFPTVFQQRVYF
jgi:hypothetical protein